MKWAAPPLSDVVWQCHAQRGYPQASIVDALLFADGEAAGGETAGRRRYRFWAHVPSSASAREAARQEAKPPQTKHAGAAAASTGGGATAMEEECSQPVRLLLISYQDYHMLS